MFQRDFSFTYSITDSISTSILFIFKNIERFREAKSNIEIKPQTGYVYFSLFTFFRASFPCFDGYDVSNNIIYNVNTSKLEKN